MARVEWALAAWTLLFVVFLASPAVSGPRVESFYRVLFTPLAVAVVALTVVTGARAMRSRDRWAWQLLACGFLLRLVSGVLWRHFTTIGAPVPEWVAGVSLLRLAVEGAGLAAFVSTPRRPEDATRFSLDTATIVVGVAVLSWYLWFSPYLRSAAAADATAIDYVLTVGGAVLVLLSALLYARRRDRGMRHAAAALAVAAVVQVVPNLAVSPDAHNYGTDRRLAVAFLWLIWLLRWYAARAELLASTADVAVVERPGYRSGVMPYLVLAAASVLLWAEVLDPTPRVGPWLLIGSSLLTASLVARQTLELRDHRRLRHLLASEEARFSAFVQHAYDLVLLVRSDGTLLYSSPAAHRFAGPAALAQPWGFLDLVSAGERMRLRELVAASKVVEREQVFEAHDAAGHRHLLALLAQDLQDDPLVGAVALRGHDVTRESDLARRLREAAEVEALGVFAGGIAHDLNNVLASVRMGTDLLLQDEPSGSPAADDLRKIQAATVRAATLTRNLLTLSRRKSTTLTPTDLRVMFEERRPPVRVAPGAPSLALVDREELGHALDALLVTRTSDGVPLGEWQALMVTSALEGLAAQTLALDPGRYTAVECHCAAVATPEDTRRTGFLMDADDINVLLARAVLREMGGTLAIAQSPEGVQVTLYLPAAVAA